MSRLWKASLSGPGCHWRNSLWPWKSSFPRRRRSWLRIDREAFGDKLADVLVLPIVLPARPEKTTLRRVLEIATVKSNFSLDYRLDATGVVLTTPQRALYTTTYDIRDIVAKPVAKVSRQFSRNTVLEAEPIHGDQPADRAARVVQALDSALDEIAPKQGSTRAKPFLVLNGVRLVIQANAAQHAQITDLLQAFRRLGDVAVIMNTGLYEVDDKFYSRLKKAGHFHSLDELEKMEREYGTPSELLGMVSVVSQT